MPAFRADAEKSSVPVSPISAEEVKKIIEDIYAAPDEVVNEAKALTTR